ncbi:SDR family NAD(P)-dependent oxidoreductase [Arenibacterium halophilum]|uniref:SDR family oxidoreductase n=1 Tax=Arenibacterium halophilum TaxID=2583821 RepID=A0ABY2XAG9_9RHOB|nr:SDR family NAD(P)-dependent oxidoreductase [Arenibacterium halophilum]TMV13326.1 SDR family oxidoreductase [Arenibacterium halophilum]
MSDLTGKTVLITGGGTGLGADMARRFAAQGARVTIAGRTRESLDAVAATHEGIDGIPADVTDEASVEALFDHIGTPDIVIANAGASTSAPFARTGLADWNAMLAVNLTGTFLTFRAAMQRMKGAPWGRLIAVASTAGLKGYAYVAPYAAAKHGVVGMVKSLALETAKGGITVNALCPGFLDTEMTDRSVANIIDKTGMSAEDARASLARNSPQKRLIRPEEVSAAALWLCGPGSEGITGQAISISGGET